MGISSVLKLVSRDFVVVREEDFDKTLESGLSEIANSLPRQHPFRKLMDLLDQGDDAADEAIEEKIEKALGDDYPGMGFVVIPCGHLCQFADYVHGDVASQWNDLFPGKKPGLMNRLNYQFRLKSLEHKFKNKPNPPEAWYRDSYADLLSLIDRAIGEKCWLVREIY